MDASSYHTNSMSTNNSYSSLPGISPHQLQHNSNLSSNLPAHTLPPLQPQHPAMQQQGLYGSAPHTPRTPATPNTPGSANTLGGFPQMNSQSRGYQMMPTNNYQQHSQPYRTSSAMLPQSSTAMSHPALAPAPAGGRMQQLRPMPANGLQHMQPPLSSPYGQNMLSQQSMAMEEQPTHVVGSQGRRGILPSAPGRPTVTATGTGSTKNAMIPAKDADGKFPCPHCTKTYLHAKHLKRHLLRHTGDRPYMCVLCRDTFSRSDILKRHFQKCSIRRGNPTGASHLSHAQAHLKKSHPGPHKSTNSMSNENDLMGVNGMGSLSDSAMHPFGVIPDGSVPDAGSNMTDEQATQEQLRVNQMKRLSTGGGRDGRSMAGPSPVGSNRASFDQSYAGGIASTMPSGMNPSLAYSMPNGQNGHSYSQGYDFAGNGTNMQQQSAAGMSSLLNGRTTMPLYVGGTQQQSSLDWSQMFQPPSHDGFMSPYDTNVNNTQVPIKTEPSLSNSNNGLFTGLYPAASHVLNANSDFPKWNIQNDYYQEISSRLLFYCFPQNNQFTSRSNEMRTFLSADNIKHFLDQFSNFQVHFPIIHLPTFRIAEAYVGLLLSMICIGAVYSDRMTQTQVREMMELAKIVIERNSQVYAANSRDQNGDSRYDNSTFVASQSEVEQITAVFMMQVLFTWHGTPIQREKARQQFALIITLARRAGLTQPMTTPPYSALHQHNVAVEHFNSASFDWNTWVEQEKRSRLMYTIFLVDAAMVVYFNTPPQLEMLEIQVPLPADDAAWEARSSTECAEALGLHGPAIGRDRNPTGSRRPKQPEMHSALKALMHSVYDLQPATTNLYSKFVLVHALHIQLWTAQRQQSQESSQMTPQSMAFSSSAASTPLSHNDWVVRGVDPTGSGAPSTNTSGRATPVEAGTQSPHTHQLLKATSNAFEKWKKAWDEDMAMQYPPSLGHSRRIGFCRDAVHFYWLGKLLMKGNMDWQMAPDQRFGFIMSMLKQVRAYVHSDSARRGEELGSVNDIDKDYGVKDLTLDMAQLFTPINSRTNSPVAGVHTNNGNGMI